MLSPLFDNQEFLFDEGWDLSTFHREAAALTDMAEFWADVENEAQTLDIVQPADDNVDEIGDWSVRLEPEEHKDKLVHHDCMWAGSCADAVHPLNTFVPSEVAPPGRSLLKRERAPSPPRPDTPPSLDEEEPPQFRHAVDVAGTALRLLRDSAAVAADHSYTLAKPAPKHQRFENLGVQTPSDSEEEIDVVSIGAGAAAAPSPAAAPQPAPAPVASPARSGSSGGSSGSRKRAGAGGVRKRRGARRRREPAVSDSEAEAPEHERRSLHNDMERMRRIGLKNLFDSLKAAVPATREKERAPKVAILREAAALCRRLQREDAERESLRRSQTRLLARLRRLRSTLAQRYRADV